MAQNKWFLIGLTIICAAAAFILDFIIWPNPPGMAMPGSTQLPFLIGVSIIEALAFGVGVTFLVSLWPMMRGRGAGDWLALFSAAWLLISWWPHDNLHRTMAMGDYWQLVRIEWGFHFTLIVAGVIVASVLWKKFAMEKTAAPRM